VANRRGKDPELVLSSFASQPPPGRP